MDATHTTAAIQAYLDQLAATTGNDPPPDAVVRALMARSVERLHVLCSAMLFQSYERLTRPPTNLRPDELLGAVVERLLKAMKTVRPGNVRQFFAIVNQHLRWELNDLARRLDEQTRALPIREDLVPAPETSGSVLSFKALRMLAAIDALPDEEREVFELIRIQGMTHPEVAALTGVSTKTVQRRLNQALLLLADELDDLRPGSPVERRTV
ncbi:MAG: sigma-70 family RNA polymerase sigma factor [Planctomycetota bacterium]|nr:sigma-70 family RNA polymerase sigma factor [Planctomycetota bacterium]